MAHLAAQSRLGGGEQCYRTKAGADDGCSSRRQLAPTHAVMLASQLPENRGRPFVRLIVRTNLEIKI
jgi:hypothetical protein